MVLVICTIKSDNELFSNNVKAWVDTDDLEEAKIKTLHKLAQEGMEVLTIVEAVKTERNDYFPPCTSLDTFIRAEQEGIAILLP